jgi:hypothetical protein
VYHSLVSDDDMADAVCSTNGVVSILAHSRARASAHSVSISSCGTYRALQYEGSELSTSLAVQSGYRLVVYGIKKDGQVLPTPIPRGDPWEWSRYEGCQLFALALGPGCTLCVCSSLFGCAFVKLLCSLTPPGTPRALFTVNPCGARFQPCVTFGSRYFSRSNLAQSLQGAISDSLWQVKRIATRREDWDVNLAKMMTWQVEFGDEHTAPFRGEHLYALVMFGKLASTLESLPTWSDEAKESNWLETVNPEDYRGKLASQDPLHHIAWRHLKTIRVVMSSLADRLIEMYDLLSDDEFRHFWNRTQTAWSGELDRRKEYEKSKQDDALD